MSTYIEKYKPTRLNEIQHNKKLCDNLYKIITNKKNIQNFLIYGTAGNGKYTIIKLLLKELYGNAIINTRLNTFEIKNKKLKLNYYSSSYHIELDLKLYKQWDKYVINNFLKSIVYCNNIGHNMHKIIIILHADCLSMQSQNALRCIIEKTHNTARYIFTCESFTKIADPIRSRFLCMKLMAPTKKELTKIIKDICKKEELKLTKGGLKKIIDDQPNGIINLKYTINLLQLSYISGKYRKYDYNYIDYMKKMLRYMDCEPKDLTVSRIDKIREHIYTLQIKQIETINVVKYILFYFLKKNISDDKKIKLCKRVAELEHRLVKGNKAPLFVESMYYSIMNIIHNT